MYLPEAGAMAGRRRSGGTNLASCVVATAFLILFIFVLLLVLFLLFRPKDPQIVITHFQVPSFAAHNDTVGFTLSQFALVRNPNRESFAHYDSTLQLGYGGRLVGFMFIPAGQIAGRRSQYLAVSFDVRSLPPGPGSLLVESRLTLKGKETVLPSLDFLIVFGMIHGVELERRFPREISLRAVRMGLSRAGLGKAH
ncbi:uncharacterized protein LOC144709847 isoform X2 [Wolffia australiana]